MATVTLIGIDIGKHSFHLIGHDSNGHIQLKRQCSRHVLIDFLAKQPVCLIVMEACCGAHWLGRKLEAPGHHVQLIAPQYVRPFVAGNKNDFLDAQAICEATSRPTSTDPNGWPLSYAKLLLALCSMKDRFGRIVSVACPSGSGAGQSLEMTALRWATGSTNAVSNGRSGSGATQYDRQKPEAVIKGNLQWTFVSTGTLGPVCSPRSREPGGVRNLHALRLRARVFVAVDTGYVPTPSHGS